VGLAVKYALPIEKKDFQRAWKQTLPRDAYRGPICCEHQLHNVIAWLSPLLGNSGNWLDFHSMEPDSHHLAR
jgi:hypothetical protein